MLTTVIVAVALLWWAIHLLERGWRGGEGSLLFAGSLVAITSIGVLLVHSLLSKLFAF